eukprot:TRINITY_DN18467_c0_g1_i1.p3 TRINITY_DN18467_c0_g1~~TRINITY_DN18467_c0_g1_i1.p3  ORF type:complete len:167 (+),score=49.23 TRINITY_DN18467_c0_g1_i1:73-501(+)
MAGHGTGALWPFRLPSRLPDPAGVVVSETVGNKQDALSKAEGDVERALLSCRHECASYIPPGVLSSGAQGRGGEPGAGQPIGLAAAAARGESQRGTQENLAVSGDGSSDDDGEVDAWSSPGATVGDEAMADAEAMAGMSDFA